MSAATTDPVVIDGSAGEGGGQVLRTSLSLSLVTGRPVRIENIRAGRRRPGLMRQHLTALQIATEVGHAQVEGAEVGSRRVEFRPQGIRAGTFRRAIGTAGSTTLVAQTILPALLHADAPSQLVLEGGTHNPLSPPFDFFDRTFLALLRRMGADVTAELVRYGFHPAGGGELHVAVRPSELRPLELVQRGELRTISTWARVADLPQSIAEREVAVVCRKLGIRPECARAEVVPNGPGNVVTIDVETDAGTEVFTAFGRIGVPAERVAAEAVREVKAFLRHDVPLGPHLADQVLLPMALAGAGTFRTTLPTTHATTNARVIEAFLPVRIEFVEEASSTWRCAVSAPEQP